MAIDVKLIDKLLTEHGHRPEDIAGEKGLLKQLTKTLLKRAMQAELTDHLGHEKHDPGWPTWTSSDAWSVLYMSTREDATGGGRDLEGYWGQTGMTPGGMPGGGMDIGGMLGGFGLSGIGP